jgi:hydrogenase expression/formation protein HypD
MKYVDEFRDGEVAKGFMEFCGGHTHAISRYGVPDLLPKACA